MQSEVDDPPKQSKHHTVQLAACRTRQNKRGYSRGKGDNDEDQPQREDEERDQGLVCKHGRDYKARFKGVGTGAILFSRRNSLMSEKQLERVRRICSALPETTERLSHGEPTFFVKNKVFVMFANNHHNDGRVAIWLPIPSGFQTSLIETAPEIYFRPPYVGVRGWAGIELDRISDKDLTFHIQVAWELIAPKRLLSQDDSSKAG